MIPRADFIAAVLSCVGTPVAHMGRKIGVGLDCGGVPHAAARAAGLDLPPTARYRRLPSGDELTSILREFCDQVANEADAHVLQVYFGRQPRHVVVPVGDGMVVHAVGKRAKVCKTRRSSQRVFALWRLRGVA